MLDHSGVLAESIRGLVEPALLLAADGAVLEISAAACELLNVDAVDAVGKLYRALFTFEAPGMGAADQHVVTPSFDSNGHLPAGSMLRLPSGQTVAVDCSISLVPGAGDSRSALLLIRPLSGFQRRVLDAVQASEGKWMALVEHAHAAIYVKEVRGAFRYVNRAFCELVGRDSSHLIGKTEFEILPLDVAELIDARERDAADSVNVATTEDEVIFAGRKRTFVSSRFRIPQLPGAPAMVCCISTETSNLLETEQTVIAQQRELTKLAQLRMAGEMASALAHELNQPLSAALSFTRAATLRLGRGSEAAAGATMLLNGAGEQIMRAGDVIKRLRAFVQKGVTQVAKVDLNAVAIKAERLMRRDLERGRVSVELCLANRDVDVFGDQLQLELVAVNFLRNALDALERTSPANRTVRISTEVLSGGHRRLLVRDSGPGIDPALMDKVFEPFFITQEEGMGLGLSICRSIIERFGGKLLIENAEPSGLVIGFTLPQ